MNAAPALTRRRTMAAAGARPPRRPRAGRLAIRPVAAVALAVVLVAALAACAAGGSADTSGDVFAARQQVSLQEVKQGIVALYRSHPGITTFAAQDIQYTTQSRDAVLNECITTSAGAGSQAAESGQVIACAPLIFFLYSYGQKASVPESATMAGELYWYAATHITGPINARTNLNELLHSWKLPVPGLSSAAAKNAVEASLVTAAQDSILGQKSVHLFITGHKAGSTAAAEQIVADIGTATGTESIASGNATASIRVTRTDAYFSGSPTGLATFIGLSSAAASKAASRWVDIKAGTNEYQDLATEDAISSLPASILPTAANTVQLNTATVAGRKVYILDWKTTASGSSTKISERLILAATTGALPISETTVANGDSQTVMLGHWGEQFTVPVPASAIPYSRVKN